MPETPEAVARQAQERAAKLRQQLLTMHEADVAELERIPVQKREHGSRLYKAFRRQLLIDGMTGASREQPAPDEEPRRESLLERLAREEGEAQEAGAVRPNGSKGDGTAGEGAVHSPAPAPEPARARVGVKPLNETLRELTRIAARRDTGALAELEADELAGPKRADVLECVERIRRERERHRDLAPAVVT